MNLILSNACVVVCLLVGLTWGSDPVTQDSPIVKTQQGSLEGLTLKSRAGKPYYAFRGIPYAEYPGRFEVFNDWGSLRVATKYASWDGIRPAKEFGSACLQINLLNVDKLEAHGEEICLFLNVFTPTLDENANLPVLFYIHGGGFVMGSGDGFDGKYFADENVIIVSIAYRLGPLGFLSFGEEDQSMANIGLKDQLLALKWVNKNIKSFGGDPSKVTLAGFSAGAASVHFHILSGQSSGLFRAAISQSGTALGYWSIQQNPRENAIKLATALECPIPGNSGDSSFKDTLACFKSKSAKEITVAQLKLKEWLIYPIITFAPVVESGKDGFITEHPEVILKNGRHNKVNWIAGFAEDEAATFDVPLIVNKTLTDILENNFEEKSAIMLGYQNLPKDEQDVIANKIRNHYFEHYEIEELTWMSLRNMLTDRYFLEPLVRSVKLHSQHSGRVFPYIFRFMGDFSIVHSLYGLEGDHGIAHGDDLQYLFPGGAGMGSPDYSGETPVEIVEFSKKFVKMLATFIKTTEPSSLDEKISWEPYTNKMGKSKPISFYEIAIEGGIWDEDITSRLKVWDDVFLLTNKSKFDKTEL